MTSATKSAVNAKGIDGERLAEIQKLPPKEMYIQLRAYLCGDILGRPKPPRRITYAYGNYDRETKVNMLGGRRALHPDAVPKAMIPPGGHIINSTGSDGKSVPIRSEFNYVHGYYSLLVNGYEFPCPWGPTRPSWNEALKRTVDQMDPEDQNMPNGMLDVDVNAQPAYFAWLDLHPMNVDSPANCRDECMAKGVTVTTGEEFTRRDPLFMANVTLSVKASLAESDDRMMALLSRLHTAKDNEVSRWFSHCNLELDPESDMLADMRVSRRKQMNSKLKALLEARDNDGLPLRKSLADVMMRDQATVDGTVGEAHRLGLLTCDGVNYFLEGNEILEVICPASRAGAEMDYLAEQIVAKGLMQLRLGMESIVQVTKNTLEDARSISDDVHQEGAAKRMAAVALAKEKGIIKKDFKTKMWVVATEGGQVDFCGLLVGKSNEDQESHLLKIASEKTDDYVYGKLALAKAVATAPE